MRRRNKAQTMDLQISTITGSSRLKDLALAAPAEEESNVFIPLEKTVVKLRKIVLDKQDGSVTFIRAPVATGKTTLAKYLATSRSKEFVMAEMAVEEEDIRKNIIKTVAASLEINIATASDFNVTEALKELAKAKKTLVLDEAHLLFAHPALAYELFKLPEQWLGTPKVTILLFSAAATAKDKHGESYSTPTHISKKYMWYPPTTAADEKLVAEDLRSAEVFLSAESVSFFMSMCFGHRGIFMEAMRWVQDCQAESTSEAEWDIHQSVAHVRHSLESSRKEEAGGWHLDGSLRQRLKRCRAVHVNGKFSTLSNIPKEFVAVLLGGSKSKTELNDHERELTISGFLVPERSGANQLNKEFVPYDWEDWTKKYGVANSLMAQYYHDILPPSLGYERELTGGDPTSGADMVVRALPFMSFATVIDNPIPKKGESDQGELNTPLSQSNDMLPFEDDYNAAFAKVLCDLCYSVSTPNSTKRGKADVVVTFGGDKTCALEQIMAAVQGQVGVFVLSFPLSYCFFLTWNISHIIIPFHLLSQLTMSMLAASMIRGS